MFGSATQTLVHGAYRALILLHGAHACKHRVRTRNRVATPAFEVAGTRLVCAPSCTCYAVSFQMSAVGLSGKMHYFHKPVFTTVLGTAANMAFFGGVLAARWAQQQYVDWRLKRRQPTPGSPRSDLSALLGETVRALRSALRSKNKVVLPSASTPAVSCSHAQPWSRRPLPALVKAVRSADTMRAVLAGARVGRRLCAAPVGRPLAPDRPLRNALLGSPAQRCALRARLPIRAPLVDATDRLFRSRHTRWCSALRFFRISWQEHRSVQRTSTGCPARASLLL